MKYRNEVFVHVGATLVSPSAANDKGRDKSRPYSPTRRAFTLIELLCVLVILGVLAAVVVPRFTSRTEQAKSTAAKSDISNIEVAIDQFQVDTGRFPTNEEGLRVLFERPANVKEWHGAYLKKDMPVDPWGNPYVYRHPGTHNNDYDLFSMGPDGREGGDDVTNWSN